MGNPVKEATDLEHELKSLAIPSENLYVHYNKLVNVVTRDCGDHMAWLLELQERGGAILLAKSYEETGGLLRWTIHAQL